MYIHSTDSSTKIIKCKDSNNITVHPSKKAMNYSIMFVSLRQNMNRTLMRMRFYVKNKVINCDYDI